MALHPDGRRLSVIATPLTQQEGFFTVPLSGGPAVQSKNRMEAQGQLGLTGGLSWFEWSRAGTALYVERGEQVKADLWKFTVDRQTLEQFTAERLTTGVGLHTSPAISPDGTRLTFTTETESVRLWSLPLAAAAGRVSGDGKAVTEAGAQALTFDLTRDGRKLAYALAREGVDREELWLTDLETGRTNLLSDDQVQGSGQWSRDGTRLAYRAFRWTDQTKTQGETAVMVRSVDGSGQQPVTTFKPFKGSGAGGRRRSGLMAAWDWSPDGQGLLVGSDQFTPPHYSLYWLPLDAAPNAETKATLLASDPKYHLWQGKFSPNGRWIAFVAQSLEKPGAATIAVMPSDGAASSQWTQVTDPREWADKPRWSPDGKLLYFILRQASFFNVWAIRFDTATGKSIGAAFQVTHFESPGRQLSPRITNSELSVSSTRLILPIMETSGNIWMLDNVDR